MLTELYIEALLVDEDLADQVWVLWDRGVFSGAVAGVFWLANNGQPLSALFFGAGLAYLVYLGIFERYGPHSYDYRTDPTKPAGKGQKVP